VLPLGVLFGVMEQPGGLQLGIDIVRAGFRVRPGTGYSQLYSTLLGDRGAAGQRSTRLIVRLDITESMRGLMYRRSIGNAAAPATERIIKALQQEGIRADSRLSKGVGIGVACNRRVSQQILEARRWQRSCAYSS
jgi:type VII secretion protein EccE